MKMLDKGLSNSHRFPDVTTSVHALCYFRLLLHSFSHAQCTISSCTSSSLDLPTPLHLPSPLTLPSSARPGLPWVKTTLTHSWGLHPLQQLMQLRPMEVVLLFVHMYSHGNSVDLTGLVRHMLILLLKHSINWIHSIHLKHSLQSL